ncbi:MAG TPA: SagB family peptide dehydrogenase, partial [Actinomycetota bacterium]|nr:SagB family peptide dehydrogenase [Actinomycetota bacterium]
PPADTGNAWHRALRGGERPDHRLDLGALSHLLFHAAGVSRRLRGPGGTFHFRTYASAGALYPNEAYVVTGEIDGLAAGVYHYAPRTHGLHRLREGDHRGALGLAGASPGEAAVVLTGIPWRTAWKYGPRGFRHLYWDAGMMLANLFGAAGAGGVPARLLLGFLDGAVEAVVDVDGRTEFPQAVVALGEGEASESEPPPRLDLPVAPISPSPRTIPGIEDARRGVRLHSAEEVEAFREAGLPATTGDGRTSTVVPPLDVGELSRDPFEVVVRRRGSSRKLARRSIPAAEVAALLDLSLKDVPTDVSAPEPAPFLIASALDRVAPGAYRYRPGGRFEAIRAGDLRAVAGHLVLDQRLGADAAATTFLCADLQAALRAMGGRGYAAAQLRSAIAAGRLYLAGYAQRLGVSGVTFFDDEVREVFRTTAEPMISVVLGPEGRRRLGR